MSFVRNRMQLFLLAVTSSLLCGCSEKGATSTQSGQPAPQAAPAVQSAPPATSQLQVEQLPQSGGSNANWGADKDTQAKPAFKRGRLLAGGGGGGGGGGAPAGNPYEARYPKYRLDKAAVIRNYAHVSIVPVGIDAFVKTAWTNGLVHIRLALLGPLKNLQEFNRTQNSVKLTFQDRAGNALQTIVVPMSELKEAPQSTNYGTPTYVVEGSLECPLETYESFYQWMFEWQ